MTREETTDSRFKSPRRHILKLGAASATLGLLSGCSTSRVAPGAPWLTGNRRDTPNVVFDTDMWADADDVLALAMLHALHDRGELNLVAVTISTNYPWSASFVDLVNTFYGHGQIPIGMGGISPSAVLEQYPQLAVSNYTQVVAERRTSDGSLTYPHRLTDGAVASEAVTQLRRTLAGQPDRSVVMIQVGYSTNLASLLETRADAISPLSGGELIERKVRLLSTMAGQFADIEFPGYGVRPKGAAEFNTKCDVASAQKVFSQWPTPIVASGFEIGVALEYPARSIEQDFGYVTSHPITEAYRLFCEDWRLPWPHDRPTWDLTSVLYAARPHSGYFSLSEPGRITVLDGGETRFDPLANGPHRYLVLNNDQKAPALEAMVALASQPPRARDDSSNSTRPARSGD